MTTLFEIASDRKAFVTGGASGIGLGVVERLLEAGARIAIADADESALHRMEARFSATSVLSLHVDVADEDSISKAIVRAADWLGGIDTLVNCAGIFQFRRLEEINKAEWDRIISVNLNGTFLAMRSAIPYLKASGRGRIVNVASDAGKRGFPLLAAYCASKFGVIGLTQAIAAEVGSQGVRVNAVCPGTVTETGMGQVVLSQKVELGLGTGTEVLRRSAESFPLGRVGTVADVADTILFLISENSGWITGESINIDGGSLAG